MIGAAVSVAPIPTPRREALCSAVSADSYFGTCRPAAQTVVHLSPPGADAGSRHGGRMLMTQDASPQPNGAMQAAADSPRGEPRLRLTGINKSFGAVNALTDVDFEVYAGEVVGLVGDNGAGKSTLIKAISGVGPPDSGEIFLEGRPVNITGPQVATRLGIETVYQDLALCDNLDVVANLFLGREERSPIRSLSEIHMEQRTLQVLRSLDVKIPSVRTPVLSLSGGQRQSIAVAKSILRNASVVLLDEPTAALGVAQTRQ